MLPACARRPARLPAVISHGATLVACAAASVGGLLFGAGILSGGALRLSLLAAVLAGATWTDLRCRRIPNRLVLAGLAAACVALALPGAPAPGAAFAASGGAAALLLAARQLGWMLAGRPGLGMGDVKLSLVLALFLGWPALWALYLAALTGGLVGGAGLLAGKLSRASRLPFAPFMAAGALLQAFVPFPL